MINCYIWRYWTDHNLWVNDIAEFMGLNIIERAMGKIEQEIEKSGLKKGMSIIKDSRIARIEVENNIAMGNSRKWRYCVQL